MIPRKMSETNILKAIETLQNVQATNKPTSKEWQAASELLHELFAEMARRADMLNESETN